MKAEGFHGKLILSEPRHPERMRGSVFSMYIVCEGVVVLRTQ